MRPSWAIQLATIMALFGSVIVSVAGSPLHQIFKSTASAATLHSQDGVHETQQSHLKERRNGLVIVKATHLKAIVPIDLAAQSLVLFYRVLWTNARQVWVDQLPTAAYTFTLGNLVMSMGSNVPIPWDFVARFATKMMGATALGFTGTYDIEYANEWTSQAVTISLRVIDHLTGLEARLNSTPLTITIRPDPAKLEPRSSDSRSEVQMHRHRRSRSKIKAHKKLRSSLKARSPVGNGLTNPYVQQRFHTSALIIPASVAPQAIKDFYERIEDFYDLISMKIEFGSWSGISPMHSFSFMRWGFELSFFSYAAPVPWDFIQEVALEMSHYARQGFTPAYDALYKAVDTLGKEIFVTVAFKYTADKVKRRDNVIHT